MPIALTGVRILWHCGYYDGPLNGIAEYQGRRYWYSATNGESYDTRVYELLDLSAEQLADEEYWHALFCEHVGIHTDYDEHGKRPCWVPGKNSTKFYGPFREPRPRDYSACKVIGQFTR